MNKIKYVFFGETIIDDGVYIPVDMRERRDSGSENIDALETRENALGCYIPFSTHDGSTAFPVFIFKRDESDVDSITLIVLQPEEEVGLRKHPHMLYLVSEKGYVTIGLFTYIVKEFVKWWTDTRSGLHCSMICDNLCVHRDDEVVATPLRSGIHLVNIMP